MRKEDLIAFARRDWAAVAEVKDAGRRERARDADPVERFAVIDALRAQVHAQRPDYPTEADREADFASHVLVAERLRRASAAR